MKVLFIVSHLNPQGPNRQLFYLCKKINRNTVEPIVVTTSQYSFKNSLYNDFKSINVKVYNLEMSKINSIFLAKKRIQKIIDLKNIDVILSYGFRSDFIAHDLKNVLKITSVRNTLLFNWEMTWGFILGKIFGNINLYYIQKFDFVIACSSSVSNYLKTLNLNAIPIRNSIDGFLVRKKYLIEGKNNSIKYKRFITISSRLKGKNIEFLLESFIQEKMSDYHLYIAGYVEQKLQDIYRDYLNIHFLGHIDSLNKLLGESHFFISASLHEGMPNAVLEAMNVGTPVLLSNIEPHKEILKVSSSKVGLLFENNSFESLFNSVKEIVNQDYDLLSDNCVKTIDNKFSADEMVRKYENLFKDINRS